MSSPWHLGVLPLLSTAGALLWEHTLPFAGLATPITYMAGGRQYS